MISRSSPPSPPSPRRPTPSARPCTTLAEATRAEEGCLAYDLFESGSAPGTFVTVERWTDTAALDAHMATPHVAAAFAAAAGALSGEVAIHPLQPVG